jgi:hypothetical protein
MGSMTQVTVFRLPALMTFYDAVFRLVKELNSDEPNARFADLRLSETVQSDQAGIQEGNTYTDQLQSKIDGAIEKSLQDEALVEGIATQWPSKDSHDLMLNWVEGWFEHDLVVTRLGQGQQWCLG